MSPGSSLPGSESTQLLGVRIKDPGAKMNLEEPETQPGHLAQEPGRFLWLLGTFSLQVQSHAHFCFSSQVGVPRSPLHP